MTPEHRTVIIRDFISSKLREFAFNSTSVSSQLFLEFSKYHFEQQTADIEKTHQDVFLRRKAKIEEKLKALDVYILKAAEAEQAEAEPEEEFEEQEQE